MDNHAPADHAAYATQVAARTTRDPQGGVWTIRERWLPHIGGLPPNDAADALDTGSALPFDVLLVPFGLFWSLLCWLARFPVAAAVAMFLPPWIDAVRETEPRIEMTWRARNRQVGPHVIDSIVARIERGELTAEVEGAEFVCFGPELR